MRVSAYSRPRSFSVSDAVNNHDASSNNHTSSAITHTSSFELGKEVKSLLQAQWNYDKQSLTDWSDHHLWSDLRSAQLKSIPGGEVVAAQYGLYMAKYKESGESFSPRLRFHNELSNTYHRMIPSKSLEEMSLTLYKSLHHQPSPDIHLAFVNSERKGRQILTDLELPLTVQRSGNVLSHLTIVRRPPEDSCLKLSSGVYALRYQDLSKKADIQQKIRLLGAEVSPYHIQRLSAGAPSAIRPDPTINNQALLERLCQPAAGTSLAKLRALPADHPVAAMADSIVSLVEDLHPALQQNDLINTHRHSPLFASGLAGLEEALNMLASQTHDNQRFSNLYSLAVEELSVVLSATQPYNMDDFKHAALNTLARSLDSGTLKAINDLKPVTFLANSGMDAIQESLKIVETISQDKSIMLLGNQNGTVYSFPYFEVLQLIQNNISLSSKTFFSSMQINTLSNEHLGGGKTLASALLAKIDNQSPGSSPINLIVDHTVEKPEDMPDLLRLLVPGISRGEVNLILCKSYQKYSNLGVAKFAAGNLTVFTANSKLRETISELLAGAEAGNRWMVDDELQPITHFLRSDRCAQAMFNKAAENTEFLYKRFFSGDSQHPAVAFFTPGVPLLQLHAYNAPVFKQKALRFQIKSRDPSSQDKLIEIPFLAPLSPDLLHSRSSFGLLTTNFMLIPDLPKHDGGAIRFGTGQESKAELTERFYMFSRLHRLNLPPWSCEQACLHVQELTDQALPEEKQKLSLAEKMICIGHAETIEVSQEQRTHHSVDALRSWQQRDLDRPFTLNKIVSTLSMLEILSMLKEHNAENDIQIADSRDRPLLDNTLKALTESGMPGVSQQGREHIFHMLARIAHADLKRDENSVRHSAIETILATVTKNPIAARHFLNKSPLPDRVIKEISPAAQHELINRLLSPLSEQARLTFTNRFKESGYLLFAEACEKKINQNGALIFNRYSD